SLLGRTQRGQRDMSTTGGGSKA
ncbi:hypothetical protein ACLKA6_004454, partial [Drosophila palustris]